MIGRRFGSRLTLLRFGLRGEVLAREPLRVRGTHLGNELNTILSFFALENFARISRTHLRPGHGLGGVHAAVVLPRPPLDRG